MLDLWSFWYLKIVYSERAEVLRVVAHTSGRNVSNFYWIWSVSSRPVYTRVIKSELPCSTALIVLHEKLRKVWKLSRPTKLLSQSRQHVVKFIESLAKENWITLLKVLSLLHLSTFVCGGMNRCNFVYAWRTNIVSQCTDRKYLTTISHMDSSASYFWHCRNAMTLPGNVMALLVGFQCFGDGLLERIAHDEKLVDGCFFCYGSDMVVWMKLVSYANKFAVRPSDVYHSFSVNHSDTGIWSLERCNTGCQIAGPRVCVSVCLFRSFTSSICWRSPCRYRTAWASDGCFEG